MSSTLNRNKKEKCLEIIYILTMAIAFTTRLGSKEITYTVPILIAFLWLVIAVIIFIYNNKDKSINFRYYFEEYVKIPSLFLLPAIFIYFYTIMLCFIGKLSFTELTTNITAYTPALSVISCMYIFKDKTLNLTVKAIILSFSFVFLFNIYTYGFDILKQSLLNIIFGTEMSLPNAFEVHDLTFASGILVLLFMFNRSLTKDKYVIFVLLLFIIFIGWKRIQILSILFIIILWFISRKIQFNKKMIKFISLFALAGFLFYVFLIDSGYLTKIINYLGINSMGRIYYYEEIAKYFDFNIFELGIGRNMVTTILTSPVHSYLNVAGVHNDILKYFAETGFIVFSLWILYFFYALPTYMLKQYGNVFLKQFYMFISYIFILYLTDNVDIYYCTQYIYILSIANLPKILKIKI